MNRREHLQLRAEKTALERMIAATPVDDILDRGSLVARLEEIEQRIAELEREEREPARVRLTFRGRPVIGSHGIFAEFGTRAVSSFAESVTAMAASLARPLFAMGPIPQRDQHQMLITSTAPGSFGFELEEHRTGQLPAGEPSAVARAIDRTRRLLQGTLGSDEDLADSASEVDSRALDKVRAFLQTLVDDEAVCTMQVGDAQVRFSDVGQVRISLQRLSRENLREEEQILTGALQGVLPDGRVFEFKLADTGQVIRGKLGAGVPDASALHQHLHGLTRIKVMVRRVGSGRPRYVLLEPPQPQPDLHG
jgi:hypothetical protein